jgi:AraC-like DNA-binding protein
MPEEPLEAELQYYGLDYLDGDISVTVVEYADVERAKGFYKQNDFISIRGQIFGYFRDNLVFDKGFEMFEISGSQFVVVTAGYSLDEVKKAFRGVMNVVEPCYDVKLHSAIGGFCDSLGEIGDSFGGALNILGYKTLFAERSVVTAQNRLTENAYYYPLDIEKSLITYVQQGEKEKVFTLLGNIIRRNRNINLGWEGIAELKFVMTATVKRALRMLNVQDDAGGLRDFELCQTFEAENLNEMEENLKNYFGKLMDATRAADAKSGNATLNRLTEYVGENYTRDISLTEVAEHYDISPGYVSKLFREYLKTTFKDYLNQYRIEKAKKLLMEDSEMKIGQIAELVGFTNVISFNRVFKRYEMVSPGDYRKNNEKA